MRKYEIMYILTPELDDETRKNEVASLANILTSNGATIDETNEWGHRITRLDSKVLRSLVTVID